MKKLVLGLSLLLSCAAAFAQGNYKVTFVNKYKGENFKPEKVYLFSIEERAPIDSATNVNGVFTFKGTTRIPQLVSVCGRPEGFDVVAAFVLDGVDTEVILENGAKVKGSETNAKMEAITQAINDGGAKQRKIQMEAGELAKKYNDQLPDSIGLRLDKEWEEATNQQMKALKDGITNNSDNLIPVYFLVNYGEVLDVEFVDNFLQTYKYKDNVVLNTLRKRLEGAKRKMAGVEFTDFTMNDMQGTPRKLSDYAGKGNYVLVDFWASWCGPCRAEMPNVKALYEKYHAKGFEIVGVSLDQTKDAWLTAVKDLGITWPQLSDLKGWKCEAAGLYGIRAIPATLLIDPNGKIIASDLRAKELEQKLEEIYK